MDLYSFIGLLFENIVQYILLATIVLFLYYSVLNKFIFSIYDPLFLNIVSSSFATTTVLFLFINKKIDSIYFYNYLLTVFSFYSVFLLFGKKIPKKDVLKFRRQKYKDKKNIISTSGFGVHFGIFFLVLAVFNILIQLFFYAKMGIPLFMESRLSVNINGGAIIGILSRIKGLFNTISMFMAFYLLASPNGKKRFIAKMYILFLVLVSLLSGSKGGLINFVFIFSVYIFYTQRINQKWVSFMTNPKSIIVLLAGGVSVLFIIHIQNRGNLLATINHLILRFAAYGDGYIYAYPNDIIKKVYNPGFLKFIFGDFLYTFRLLNGRPAGLGFELSNIIYNVDNSVTGPNPRFNIAGYAYFGFYGSIITAIISGVIFTSARNTLVAAVDKKYSKQICAYFVSSLALSIESDICQVIVNLTTNLFLQSIVFIFIALFIIYLVPKNKMAFSYFDKTSLEKD